MVVALSHTFRNLSSCAHNYILQFCNWGEGERNLPYYIYASRYKTCDTLITCQTTGYRKSMNGNQEVVTKLLFICSGEIS